MGKDDYKTPQHLLLEKVVRDLNKLPIKDAVFSNNDEEVTKVIEAKKVDMLIEKYEKTIKKWEI